jgi:formiminoglutamase
LLSVPHAGLEVPEEARAYCVLTLEQIAEDGDEGAREIYDLEIEVEAFVTTDVARAIIDLNRAEDDRRPDGVVKTHTCFNVPVYDPFLPEGVIEALLERYYRTYHARLRDVASGGVRLGVDCHTMLAIGPPIGPGAGEERPAVCLSSPSGSTSRSRVATSPGPTPPSFPGCSWSCLARRSCRRPRSGSAFWTPFASFAPGSVDPQPAPQPSQTNDSR